MGSNPSVSTSGGSTVSTSYGQPVQMDKKEIEDRIRALPSHLAGMNEGQYYDLRNQLDSLSRTYLGHDSTDGIVSEVFHNSVYGGTAKWMEEFYLTHSPDQLGSYQTQTQPQ